MRGGSGGQLLLRADLLGQRRVAERSALEALGLEMRLGLELQLRLLVLVLFLYITRFVAVELLELQR
jgi:hypothetical protein